MFSVTPELYTTISLVSRWLFVFIALLLLFFAFLWHRAERRDRRERFKNLTGAGTVGELLVLSGSDELPPDTWFPVPREGVLGSLRSCDLVIPCPGVSPRHLDFSWQDGTGLLIRPHIGCEVLVDGMPVDRRAASEGVPLVHGSVLQVGTGVLRLQLFAALSHTNRIFSPAAPASQPASPWGPPQAVQAPQYQVPMPQPWQPVPDQIMPPPSIQPPMPPQSQPQVPPQVQPQMPPAPVDMVQTSVPAEPLSVNAPAGNAVRRKRADRWKEDWSE